MRIPMSSGPHRRAIQEGEPVMALSAETVTLCGGFIFVETSPSLDLKKDSMPRHVRPELPICVLRHVPTTKE